MLAVYALLACKTTLVIKMNIPAYNWKIFIWYSSRGIYYGPVWHVLCTIKQYCWERSL